MTTTELETQARELLRPDPENSGRLKSRESTRLEFKESFSRAGRAKYAKTLAAFANNSGGFIVFGVTDSPRELVGVDGERFDAFASESFSGYLNATFAPELEWEAFTTRVGDVLLGVLHVAKAKARPVVALRNDADVIRESDIFYRYRARSERIRYAGEVRSLLAGGADPNVPDRAGRTALHGAARLGAVETMSALLRCGGRSEPTRRGREHAASFRVRRLAADLDGESVHRDHPGAVQRTTESGHGERRGKEPVAPGGRQPHRTAKQAGLGSVLR